MTHESRPPNPRPSRRVKSHSARRPGHPLAQPVLPQAAKPVAPVPMQRPVAAPAPQAPLAPPAPGNVARQPPLLARPIAGHTAPNAPTAPPRLAPLMPPHSPVRRIEPAAPVTPLGNLRVAEFPSPLVAPGAAKIPRPNATFGPAGMQVTAIPPVPPNHREVEMTSIVAGRSWVRILFDELDHSYVYEAIEPRLSDDEKAILAFLRDTLVRTLDGRQAVKERKEWAEVLLEAARQAIEDHSIRLDDVGRARVEHYLVRDFLGYGRVDVLLRDPMIEDISCDGPNIPIYLFHRKYESMRTNLAFDDELELDGFVVLLAQRSGKHISVADPLLDATLPDGSRLQATLSREVTTRGSSFTVRKFRADPMTPPDLIRFGTMSPEMAAYFWFVMEMGASFMLAGGTASGKTTTLNAVSQFIPPEKKIVSIEDTREINLSHDNWIAGITRSGFGGEIVGGKLAGAVDMYKLLEAALRQRPEYLLVGEVRGPEALTLFQAMATGHAVYSTMHADAVQSAVYRLESEPINVPRMMLQTLDLMAIQAQVRIGGHLARRVKEVTEFVGFDPDSHELLTNTVFDWDVKTDRHRYLGKSYILEHIMETRNLPQAEMMEEWRRRTKVIEWMVANDVRHYAEVAKAISAYYRDPPRLLAIIEGKSDGARGGGKLAGGPAGELDAIFEHKGA